MGAVFFQCLCTDVKVKATAERESSGTREGGGKKPLEVSTSCLYVELKTTHWETFIFWKKKSIVHSIINAIDIPTRFLQAELLMNLTCVKNKQHSPMAARCLQ